MKKKIIALLASMTAACSLFALTACNESCSGDNGGETDPPIVDVGGDEENANYTIRLEGTSTSRTIDLDAEDTLRFSVMKNGAAVTGTDAEVTVSLDGDSVTYTVGAGSIKILPVKVGKTVLTISLKNHPEAASKTFTYTVADFFFSRDLQRGDINLSDESNNRVIVKRANDAASLVYKKASKNFVFKATIELPANARPDTTGESFGLASFRDAGGDSSIGDNALWFGAKSSAQTGIYSIYQRNFYQGWGSPKDERTLDGYQNRDFGTDKVDMEVEIIRNGFDYYYSINGFYGKYTDSTNFDEATYPGIYSQHFSFIVKDFSVTMDEEEVTAAAEAYSQKGYATVSITEKSLSYLVNDKTYNFTGKAYPTLAGDGNVALTWSIITDELDNKGDTVINNVTGELTVAAGATGYITVKCEGEGGISDTFRVRVRNAVETYQDNLFNYTGGVELIEEGKFVFPEEFSSVDGVGDENNYSLPDNKYYALSKNTYRGAYSVEFKLSDYKNYTGDKLEISLGEGNNNFYICRQRNRVEAHCLGTFASKAEVAWFSAPLLSGFDWNSTNTFKFEVTANGTYAVYVNGVKLQFVHDNTYANATIKKPYDRLLQDGRVKLAVKGVSATVSEISITQGELNISGATYVANSAAFGDYDENGFTINIPEYTEGNWNGKYHYATRIAYIGSKWSKLSGAYVIEFDVDFEEAMKDGKLVLKIGDYEYHILNKYSDSKNLYGYILMPDNDWSNGTETVITDISGNNILGVHVRLEVDANHNVKLYMNDVIVGDGVALSAAPSASFVEFYTYCSEGESGNSITVSNLTLSDYSAKSGVLTVDVQGGVDRALSEEEVEQLNFTVKLDGKAITAYTLSYDVTGTDVISLNESTKTVTALKKGKATIVVTITPTDSSVAPKTITLVYEVSDFFFHKNMHRGNYEIIKDGEGNETGVSLNGGNSGVVYRDASTKWVFSGTISFNDWTETDSINISSTRGTNATDVANNDLWFGISCGNEGKYKIVTREFYGGWAGTEYTLATDYAIPLVNGKRVIDFTLIRDGNNYYFKLGDFVVSRSVTLGEATYPGIFTQLNPVTLTNMSIEMTDNGVAQAINKLKAETPMTSLKIDQKILALTAGEEYEFTAVKTPAFISEGYVWSIDKSGLTAGAAEVSIDATTGVLTTGENSVGTLVIIATSAKGNCTDRFEIELTKEEIPTENDLLAVYGATLAKDASGNYTKVVFSESMQNVDGIISDDRYVDNNSYSANLKNTVKGNFSIEFTVSNYKTDGRDYPKLMVSLGGEHNQFYVVYYRQQNVHQIETMTESIDDNGVHYGNQWVNAPMPAGFDPTAEHTYKITVQTDGTYKMYVDGVELTFNMDGTHRIPVRRIQDYGANCNVRFATSGVSATLSDITVVNGTDTSNLTTLGNLYTENYNAKLTADGFVLKAGQEGWGNEKLTPGGNQVNYTGAVTANTEITFKLAFSGGMSDGKFVIDVGGNKVMLNNKVSASQGYGVNVQNIDNDWTAYGTFPTDIANEMYLKIVRANGQITVYVGATEDNMTLLHTWANAGTDTGIHFYLFNGNSSEKSVTATVSELSVTEYTA
ncbi:MAG: hypothetical protein K2O89_05435 [Clostridia bacterium]|nr:hypothetical protein [Clostridia bacterium]